MKRLPPAKRNNLIMVILGTIGLVCAVYFLLIQPQNESNKHLAKEISDKQADLEKIGKAIRQADATAVSLSDVSLQLSRAEEDVVSGDVFAATYDTIRRFKTPYHVDIPSIGQPSLSEVDLLGSFPYKQVRVQLSGTAFYHDLGKFVADFENNFPHMRMVNLAIEPATGPGVIPEKLAFRVDVIALVKPNS